MEDQEREKDLRKAEILQKYNVAYDRLEVGVSLVAGFMSGSAALIGWGLKIAPSAQSPAKPTHRIVGRIPTSMRAMVTQQELKF